MTKSTVVLQLASLVPPARFGGAERVVGSFAEQLELAGFTVHNRGLKPRGGDDSEPGVSIENVYWPFDGRRRGALPRAVWHGVDTFLLTARRTVADLVDELDPDVLVTHNLRGWGLAPWVVAAERQLPLVHVVHDYGLVCNSTTLWSAGPCEGVCTACRPRAWAARRHWPGGRVVGVSRAVLAEHAKRGLEDFGDGAVVHPTAAAQKPTSAGRLARGDGPPTTVGYLGRLGEAKGIDVLLGAVADGQRRLVVAGEGEPAYVDQLRARTGGNVQWFGWTDTAAFFDGIDVLVVPSVWLEPFGLVVVEAAHAGVPVLIAERPGLIEAARAAGARHATFVANSVDALRAALDLPLSAYRVEPPPTGRTDIVEVVSRLVSEGRTTWRPA